MRGSQADYDHAQYPPRHKGARPPRRKRRFLRWLVALPFTLLVLVLAGWSVGWATLAGRLEAEVDTFLEREAEAGRIYTCASRSVGGFPFRLEIECLEPTARIGEGLGAVTLRAERLLSVAQIYDWELAIAEIQGPGRIEGAGMNDSLVADWRLGQASYRGSEEAMERTALVFDDLLLDVAPAGTATPRAEATRIDRLGVHLRPTPDAAEGRSFDIALNADGIDGGAPGESGSSVALDARAERLPQGWSDLSDFMRLWHEADGQLRINGFSVDWGEVAARIEGALALHEAGWPIGDVTADIAGLDALTAAVPEEMAPGDLSALVNSALGLVGERAEIEGRDATRLRLSFAGGQIRLGPFALVELPRLF